jgi:hypothetical protein
VHIQSTRELSAGLGGQTQFVVSRSGYRYLRITLAAQLPRDLRVAILAHELQHAREVAESDAYDIKDVERLFDATGQRDGHRFETRAAISVERAVCLELRAGAPAGTSAKAALQAEPVVKFDH